MRHEPDLVGDIESLVLIVSDEYGGRVVLLLLRRSALTAALLVFVDVMKELPATFVMRPFNFDTLAVQAYNLASDERLAEAATPALTIVVAGLLPLLVLSRMMLKEAEPALADRLVTVG